MKTCALLIVALAAGCGFEQPILNSATEKGPDWVPDAPDPYLVKGQVFALPNAPVDFYAPTGTPLGAYAATSDAEGGFESQFPGSTGYRNLVVVASDGPVRIFGLAVEVPRNLDIYYDPQDGSVGGQPFYHLAGMANAHWRQDLPPESINHASNRVMSNLDDRTTAVTLIMLRNVFENGKSLSSVSVASTNQALEILARSIAMDLTGPVYDLYLQVARLLAASAGDRFLPPVFLFPDSTGVFLNPEFLLAAAMDFTGDGHPDFFTLPFENALGAAAAEIELLACEPAGTITTVFMVDLTEGNRDPNCTAINPFKIATDEAGKRMFIVGGMKTDDPDALTPVCAGAKKDDCITKAEWAEVNAAFGGWSPNTVPMRDDGEGGDSVAGDNIWTIVIDLPYIKVGTGAEQRKGVRIGYKYTYGFPGQASWGGAEEWPGNHRLLELADVNGDGLIVRYDYFGDEASNKAKDNTNKGLCVGTLNPWPEQASPGCFSDTHENQVDTNEDCIPDSFVSAGAVAPACDEPGSKIWPVKGSFEVSDAVPTIASVLPAAGKNGGGFLVQILGADFRPAPSLSIEVNTAADMTVSNNMLPGVPGFLAMDPGRLLFSAPRFPAKEANVVVIHAAGEPAKAGLSFTVSGTAPCSLLFPGQMPDAAVSVPSGVVDKDSYPVFGLLALEDPSTMPALRVELGLSPACCNDSDVCPVGYPPCYDLPDPTYEPGWVFVPMDEADDCPEEAGADCSAGQVYVGKLVPPVEKARFRYAVRYTEDYGQSWDYCDLPEASGAYGNDDGFALKNAGTMWVE